MRIVALLVLILIGSIALLRAAPPLLASANSTVTHGTTQALTAFGVCKKVTNGSATGLSVYVPTQTSAEWQSFHTSPPAGVSIGSCSVTIPIATSQSNVDLCTLAGNPTTPGTYVFTIAPGATVYSTSASQPALTTGNCWPAGSTITIVNNGAIYGRGGDGGSGGGAYVGTRTGAPGASGGTAISLAYPISIDNSSGFIFGGGGGGGGAGSSVTRGVIYGGGGGGGGQGAADSIGGSGGSSTFAPCPTMPSGGNGTVSGAGTGGFNGTCRVGAGGNGGTWGNSGNAGANGNPASGGGVGGTGGAGGAAVQRNGYTVTWLGGSDATHVKGAVSN